MRVLVVEDESALAEAIVETFEDESYAVDHAADGATASELMAVNSYDLVILDWSIPPPSGMELLREWRAEGVATPVLMLTGRTEVEEVVTALDTGADDYLSKPFSFEVLLARARSLIRRRNKPLVAVLAAADVEMNRPTRTVTVGGEPIDLPAKEFALLEYFLTRVDEVVPRQDIVEHVWDDSFDATSNVIDVTVFRLRKKIDGSREEKLLQTVKGAGYMLRSRRQ